MHALYKKMEENISFDIAGVTYHKEVAKNIFLDDILEMKPDTKYGNAIAIYTKNNELCGYVPKIYIDKVKKIGNTDLKVTNIKKNLEIKYSDQIENITVCTIG